MNLPSNFSKEDLPKWFTEDILEPLEAGIGSVFIIHGDINCLIPNHDLTDQIDKPYIKFREFWRRILSEEEIVVFYNIASGISFLKPEMEEKFKKAADLVEESSASNDPVAAASTDLANRRALPVEPGICLNLIEKVLRKETGVSVIINSAHFVAPISGGNAAIIPTDRINIQRLRNWSQSETIRNNRNLVVLLTDEAMKISAELRLSGNEIQPVFINKPTPEERKKFLKTKTEGLAEAVDLLTRKRELESRLSKVKKPFDRNRLTERVAELSQQLLRFPEIYSVGDGVDLNMLTAITQGLSLAQIQEILTQSKKSGSPLNITGVKEKKHKILANEYSDIMEVVNPLKGLEDIGGMEHLKKEFRKILDAIKKGDFRRVPMGITLMGPPGTGKTAFVEALAHEAGFHFVKIKNIRSMWVGESEARMEKLLNALRNLAPVVVMNDEADLGEADRNAPKGDSGVSERLMQAWMTFLSDPKIRGKVIVINCTNRPDRMDAALKRSGRSDLRLILPMPSVEEIPEIFKVMFKRYGIQTSITDFVRFAALVKGFSGADIESISLQALKFAVEPGEEDDAEIVVDDKALKKAIDDFIPSASQADIDYMTLVSLLASSSRELLPSNMVDILIEIKKRNLVTDLEEIFNQIRERKIVELP